MTHIKVKLLSKEWIKGKLINSNAIGLRLIEHNSKSKISIPYTSILYHIVEEENE